jgi:hypothetical protein
MATIYRTISTTCSPDEVWGALADPGAIHERLARGFVVATELDGDVRTVTFAGGSVARELVVSIDRERRRLAYSVIESSLGLEHHHSTFTAVERPDGQGCVLEWVVDLSPDSALPALEAMVDLGCQAIATTLSP